MACWGTSQRHQQQGFGVEARRIAHLALLHLPGVRQIRSFIVLKQVLSTTQITL
jgi:hypothetical protein